MAGVKRTRSHPELDYEQALIDYHAISSSLDVSEPPRFWLNVGLLLLVGACWLVSAILMLRAKKVGREITPEQDALLDEYWANLWRAFGLATVTWLFVQDPIKAVPPSILDHGRAKYARRCLRMLISLLRAAL